jgi:hypothetical protein
MSIITAGTWQIKRIKGVETTVRRNWERLLALWYSRSVFDISLRLIDLGKNKVTPEIIKAAFGRRERNESATTKPQYYAPASHTLTLAFSTPPSKAHSHAFSFAASSSPSTPISSAGIAFPTASLPLALITVQPFAGNLQSANGLFFQFTSHYSRRFSLPAELGRPQS